MPAGCIAPTLALRLIAESAWLYEFSISRRANGFQRIRLSARLS